MDPLAADTGLCGAVTYLGAQTGAVATAVFLDPELPGRLAGHGAGDGPGPYVISGLQPGTYYVGSSMLTGPRVDARHIRPTDPWGVYGGPLAGAIGVDVAAGKVCAGVDILLATACRAVSARLRRPRCAWTSTATARATSASSRRRRRGSCTCFPAGMARCCSRRWSRARGGRHRRTTTATAGPDYAWYNQAARKWKFMGSFGGYAEQTPALAWAPQWNAPDRRLRRRRAVRPRAVHPHLGRIMGRESSSGTSGSRASGTASGWRRSGTTTATAHGLRLVPQGQRYLARDIQRRRQPDDGGQPGRRDRAARADHRRRSRRRATTTATARPTWPSSP